MKAMLVLNGEACQLNSLADYAGVFCSDGGYRHLTSQSHAITAVIGDQDSVIDLPAHVPFIFRPNQNFTDFDKSLMTLIDKGYTQVDVFCVGGGEQDHFLGNLNTVYRFRQQLDIVMYDRHQSIISCSDALSLNGKPNDIVSIYPYPCATVSSQGLCYEMDHMKLDTRNNISLRNALTSHHARIEIHTGDVFIFQTRNDISEIDV